MKNESMNECVIEWLKGDDIAYVTMPNRSRLKTRVIQLAQSHDEVEYLTNDDGSIYAKVPSKWVRINPTKKMSEKQLENARKNLRRNTGGTA